MSLHPRQADQVIWLLLTLKRILRVQLVPQPLSCSKCKLRTTLSRCLNSLIPTETRMLRPLSKWPITPRPISSLIQQATWANLTPQERTRPSKPNLTIQLCLMMTRSAHLQLSSNPRETKPHFHLWIRTQICTLRWHLFSKIRLLIKSQSRTTPLCQALWAKSTPETTNLWPCSLPNLLKRIPSSVL